MQEKLHKNVNENMYFYGGQLNQLDTANFQF